MSKRIEEFNEMVNFLLNIINFQKLVSGYLQAVHEFLPSCIALNRHNYARNLSYHLMDMNNLKERIPEAYEYLSGGPPPPPHTHRWMWDKPYFGCIETTFVRRILVITPS